MDLRSELVDSHAHLEHGDFAADVGDVLARARAAGVRYVVVPATDAADAAAALRLAREHQGVFFAAGLHPNNGLPLDDAQRRGIRAALEEGKREGLAVAVGECGLDYHYLALPRDDQIALVRWHLALAREVALPVIFHQRDAEADLRRLWEKENPPPGSAVLHCFPAATGDYYRWARGRGLYVSFTGSVTFPAKKGGPPPPAWPELDLAATMLESDAPYMTPVPYRGRRNEPAYLPLVAAGLAARAARDPGDVLAGTTLAARTFFRLPPDFGGAVAYGFKDAIYLNITNRCTNDCVFCLRRDCAGVGGYDLRLKMEPTVAEALAAVDALPRRAEAVFCGFGEPTVRWEAVKAIARGLQDRGFRVRLDTNGSANLNAGRDVAAELAGLFDAVAVSVNAADADVYGARCRPRAPAGQAWEALAAFVAGARRWVPAVEITAVALDAGAADRLAALARAWGVGARLRPRV